MRKYYIVIRKEDNQAEIFSTKKAAAKHVNICTATITRGFAKDSYIDRPKYSIYISNGIKRAKTGFALNK